MSEPKPPQPLHAGAVWEELKLLNINEGEWRINENYVCRTCGQPAFLHPNTNTIWGCKQCGMSTASVWIYFRPRG